MNKNIKYGIAGIIAVAVIVSVAMNLGSTSSSDDVSDVAEPMMRNVGVMLPVTGDLASHGADNRIATELALVDFNAYLVENRYDWQMNLVLEDTQTDPIIALDKIQSLNSKGIKFILGPETSAELRNVKSYADSNDIIMISPSSTSPKLAFDDNLFRFVPDDTKQGKVLAKLLDSKNIKVVVPVYRGDVWGDGLYESTRDSFESIGGIMDEGLRYSPEITVFSAEAKLLSDRVGQYTDEYATEEVGVLIIGFSEVVHFFNSANSYDSLSMVPWFGSDGSSTDNAITEDKIASNFAQNINFISTQFAASDNEKYDHVKNHLIEVTGSPPSNYAYAAYDSLWVMGLTMLAAEDDMSSANMKSLLPMVSADYVGAIGQVNLNEAGDLAISDYELWYIVDGHWDIYGRYSAATDMIIVS